MSLSVDQGRRLEILERTFNDLFAKGPDKLSSDEWNTIGELGLVLAQFSPNATPNVKMGWLMVSQLATSRLEKLVDEAKASEPSFIKFK